VLNLELKLKAAPPAPPHHPLSTHHPPTSDALSPVNIILYLKTSVTEEVKN